ncbi:MAG TPA: ABC-three component system middle component 6 [Thermoanaerobaculia bacterium]|jgi:hypothetical protein|nr:ABC-three component system middle component 6 [Thermoanaerobaculia bacterium]
MILPSKHLPQDRALLTVGAHVLLRLSRPKTVSAVWEEVWREGGTNRDALPRLTYDWFVLALDLLFAVGAIELKEGLLARRSP